jgi:hypothetical protein
LSIVRYSRNWKTRRFGKLILFGPQVRARETSAPFRASGEGETPTLLGPLERANLNHWTRLSSERGDTYSVASVRKS